MCETKKLSRYFVTLKKLCNINLVSDILVRNRCIKEEDLLTLCKFEKVWATFMSHGFDYNEGHLSHKIHKLNDFENAK